MPAIARGRCQWEAFEKDLADALRTCEAPRLQPRRSALGFFPLPQTATHLAAAARALSADVAPAVLGTLLEECRRGSRHSSLSKAVAWEEMEQPVAEEEAPLEPWLRGRRASPEGSPSRSDALGWQLPGRPWVQSTALALPTFEAVGATMNANRDMVDQKASPSMSSERPHSWSNGQRRTTVSAAVRSPRDCSPSVSHDLRSSVGRTPSSLRAGSLQAQQTSTANDAGTEGSPLQAGHSGSTPSVLAAPTALAAQRTPLRAFSSNLVLDIPTSRMGLRRTSGDSFASSSSAITLAKLERHTVTSPFHGPQGIDLHTEAAECAICMDVFKEGEMIRTLQCCHRFHACCVDPWLLSRWQCPLCKLEVSDSSAW